MLKKMASYYKLLATQIAVLILLSCSSFAYINGANYSTCNHQTASNHAFFNLDKTIVQQKKSDSTTPTKSFVLIEEQEEDTNDDNKNEALIICWISAEHQYKQQSSSLAYTYNFKNCPQPVSVPLYVLFHSWKNFIC